MITRPELERLRVYHSQFRSEGHTSISIGLDGYGSLIAAASTAITLEAFLREHGPRIRSLLEIKATLTEDQTQAHHWQAALDALSALLATLAKETK